MRATRFAGILVGLAATGVCGVARAAPGHGYMATGGGRFYVAAPSSFTWNQFNVVTSATGNSSAVYGSTGPVTVNQTSGPVVVFGGVGNGWGGAAQGATGSTGGLLGLQGLNGLVNVGPGASGGLINVNTGAVSVSGGGVSVNPGSGQGATSTNGGSTPALGVSASVGGAAGTTTGAGVSANVGTSTGGLGVGVNVGGGGSGLSGSGTVNLGGGATTPVQVCTTCLTGGVGG